MIHENDQESIATEKKDVDEIDSDEELGRSEEDINLEQVSVRSSAKSSASAKQKAILSPEEVKEIQDKTLAAEEQKKKLKEHED